MRSLIELIGMIGIGVSTLIVIIVVGLILLCSAVQATNLPINSIGNKHVGDKFTITGETNLAVGDNIIVQIYSSSFTPTEKSQSGAFSGATGTVQVVAGTGTSGLNQWSFYVDTSTFEPGEYLVTASAVAISPQPIGTAMFNLLEGAAPTAVPTTVVTTAGPTMVATTVPPTAVATPTKTPPQPGFGAVVALIGLGAVAFLVVRRH
jgi:PGF-CTERM protein